MIVDVLAPAKLNLGLEVLGRRPDGYHEIRTVMASVSLFDRLTVRSAEAPRFYVDDGELDIEGNLVQRAAEIVQAQFAHSAAHITLRKRIPVTAGLGGASSDAAATLIGLNRCFDLNFAPATLHAHAARIGSDVPFFLTGGTALISGRGETVTPIGRSKGMAAVIVAPDVTIPAKTATLYAALTPADFSGGERASLVAESVGQQSLPDEALLANAFKRALYELVPELGELPALIRRCGASRVALSGAGPAHYSLEPDLDRAHAIARRLRSALPPGARVLTVRFVAGGPLLNCRHEI